MLVHDVLTIHSERSLTLFLLLRRAANVLTRGAPHFRVVGRKVSKSSIASCSKRPRAVGLNRFSEDAFFLSFFFVDFPVDSINPI